MLSREGRRPGAPERTPGAGTPADGGVVKAAASRERVHPAGPAPLRAAFPAALGADADLVIAALPPAPRPHADETIGPVVIGRERLRIPCRVFFPEPADAGAARELSGTQRLILASLYTRHHDGFVRHRHVRTLLATPAAWAAPFIVALVGEYVVEIVETIAREAAEPVREQCRRFVAENPAFAALTRRRVMSYWDRYYRERFPRFRDYPPFRVITTFGSWPPVEGRHLLHP